MINEIPELFMVGTKAYADRLVAIAHIAFAGTEQLTALNLDLGRALLEDSATTCSAMLATKNPEEYLDANKIMAQPMLEKLVAHWQSVYKIGSLTQAHLLSVIEAQHTDLQHNLSETLEKVAKSGAPGSDAAIAAVKAAIAASNAAYHGINKATQHAAETAEAGLAATVNAVSTNGKAAPKMRKSAAA